MARLTKKIVEQLESRDMPFVIWDEQLAGFGVKILPSMKRQYLVKYRVSGGRAGRQRWYLLGSHGRITCEQARHMAQQVLAAVARGEDPQQARTNMRAAPNVEDLWKRYEVEHLPKKKASSARNDR